MEKYLLLGAVVFFSLMSLITLILYKVDKVKAEKKKWRTKEATLLGFGFFGGAAGALAGMKLFRHKTKHWYFWVINIAGLLWQILLLIFLAIKFLRS